MSDLNYYALNKVIGGKMKPVKHTRFGNFHLLETTAEALRTRSSMDTATSVTQGISRATESLIVRAFEEVRGGMAPDSLLWDKDLAVRFHLRCAELGVGFKPALMTKRLLNIRKNAPRYKSYGIGLSPTTVSEPHASIVPQFAHAIEFALVRLKYRFGASIDDILMDPDLGEEFEQLTLAFAPHLSSRDMRLGALCIRKSRHFKKRERDLLGSLNPRDLDPEWTGPTSLKDARSASIPDAIGLLSVYEEDRSLYVARNTDLRAAVGEFCDGPSLMNMSSHFWTPDPDRINIRFIPGERIRRIHAHKWELRLIQTLHPVFNWPVHSEAA